MTTSTKVSSTKAHAKQRVALLTKRIKTNVVFGLSVEKVQRIYNRKLGVNVSYYVAKTDLQNLIDKAEAFRTESGRYFSKGVANSLGKTLHVKSETPLTPLQGNPAYLSQQERQAREYPQVAQLCIIHDVQGTLIIEYKGCIFASYKEAQEYLNETLRPQRYETTGMYAAALFAYSRANTSHADMLTMNETTPPWLNYRGSYGDNRY